MPEKKKRGRPARTQTITATQSAPTEVITQEKIVEVLREVVQYVPEPRLEGYELYAALKDKNYHQGGSGQYMENPNGIDSVYIPTYQELITSFIGNPDVMDKMRDAIIRAYIELQ